MRPDIAPEASPVSRHNMKTRHPPATQSKTRRLEALRKKAFEKFAFGFRPSSVAGMLGIPVFRAKAWKAQFKERGPDGYRDLRFRGKPEAKPGPETLAVAKLPTLVQNVLRRLAFRMLASGARRKDIMTDFRLAPATASRWISDYRKRGVDGYAVKRGGFRPRKPRCRIIPGTDAKGNLRAKTIAFDDRGAPPDAAGCLHLDGGCLVDDAMNQADGRGRLHGRSDPRLPDRPTVAVVP